MSELAGLPLPDDAPAPGSCVRIERPEQGLVVLVLDPPHRTLPVLDLPLLRDLDQALTELGAEIDARTLRGLVIAGREPLVFAAGADVKAIEAVTDPALALRFVRYGQQVFQRVHRYSRSGGGRVTVVCAAGGAVPGGAYELALACDRIVLARHDKTRVGLPEVRLGIAPGWGGTQRLPRRIGLTAALEVILQGKLYPAEKALRMGLVDRLTWPEYVRRLASEVALGRASCPRRSRGSMSWLVDRNPAALSIVRSRVSAQVMRETRGRYPAPPVALDLVCRAAREPLASGLEREAAAVASLAVGPIAKNLVSLFVLSEDAKKLGKLVDGSAAPSVKRAGVIGAGVMGAAIASLMAENGIDARLADVAREPLVTAERAHRAEIAKQLARRRQPRHRANAAIDRFETTTELVGFARCDLVIEAVAENLEVKRKVLSEIAWQLGPDAILATNTSSLSVDRIAQTVPHPERVVGVHFFNPVRKMPLVEIVRGPKTAPEVVARAARFALDLGKTPVVVADVAGFLVNRILGPYLDEAVRLFEAGAAPESIDAAAVEFGMPMGPLELLDEVGLDIAGHAGASLEAAYGERMTTSKMLAGLVAKKELGKKTGRGVYLWERGERGRSRKLARNPSLPAPASSAAAALAPADIQDRLILAMVAEAARCLEERVVGGPRELDLASVFGMGFAPFRGGLWRHAHAVGLPAVAARLKQLAAMPDVASRPGGPERYAPSALLVSVSGERPS